MVGGHVDYNFLQMRRHRETERPRTPDPDEEWKKRMWDHEMTHWRRELRQWRGDAGSEEEMTENTKLGRKGPGREGSRA